MKRFEVSFNQVAYEVSINQLQSNLKKLIKCLDCIEVITGKREYKDLQDIQNYILEKTKFKNIGLSSGLLNVSEEYSFLEQNLNSIDHDVIEYRNDVPFLKDSIISQMKQAHTTFLHESHIKDYEVLKKVSDLLNTLSKTNLTNCLKTDYLGVYSVNLFALNNSNHI